MNNVNRWAWASQTSCKRYLLRLKFTHHVSQSPLYPQLHQDKQTQAFRSQFRWVCCSNHRQLSKRCAFHRSMISEHSLDHRQMSNKFSFRFFANFRNRIVIARDIGSNLRRTTIPRRKQLSKSLRCFATWQMLRIHRHSMNEEQENDRLWNWSKKEGNKWKVNKIRDENQRVFAIARGRFEIRPIRWLFIEN